MRITKCDVKKDRMKNAWEYFISNSSFFGIFPRYFNIWVHLLSQFPSTEHVTRDFLSFFIFHYKILKQWKLRIFFPFVNIICFEILLVCAHGEGNVSIESRKFAFHHQTKLISNIIEVSSRSIHIVSECQSQHNISYISFNHVTIFPYHKNHYRQFWCFIHSHRRHFDIYFSIFAQSQFIHKRLRKSISSA